MDRLDQLAQIRADGQEGLWISSGFRRPPDRLSLSVLWELLDLHSVALPTYQEEHRSMASEKGQDDGIRNSY